MQYLKIQPLIKLSACILLAALVYGPAAAWAITIFVDTGAVIEDQGDGFCSLYEAFIAIDTQLPGDCPPGDGMRL